jgi:hypothetical protein
MQCAHGRHHPDHAPLGAPSGDALAKFGDRADGFGLHGISGLAPFR